jgi:hypothetical protein
VAAVGPEAIGTEAITPDSISRVPLVTVLSDDPKSFAEIVYTWLPLTYALNVVNRSMGNLYPLLPLHRGTGQPPLRARRRDPELRSRPVGVPAGRADGAAS